MDINQLHVDFKDIFAQPASRVFFSPGRVNLIGEHTDYNGGHVFPCAITQGTYGLVAARPDRTVRCYSNNLSDKGIISFSLDDLDYQTDHSWANFVKGVFKYIMEAGHDLPHGLDFLVAGNIPNGAGLSSSASLELLAGVMVNECFDLGIDRLNLVKLGQQVENHYIGVNSGIMDQFAIGMGQKDVAIYLDTNTLDYSYVPADFGGYKLLIMNTKKRRELVDSKYNTRRSECEEALARLQQDLDIQSLGDLDTASFEAHRYLINDPVLEARARHAVTENERTVQAKERLEAGDLEAFGQLLNASHTSLKEDYDVTGLELDTLVEAAQAFPSVLGARMTGAGMGGCAIALVEADAVDEVIEAVQAAYQARVGYPAEFYLAEVGPGTCEIR